MEQVDPQVEIRRLREKVAMLEEEIKTLVSYSSIWLAVVGKLNRLHHIWG